MRKSLGKEMRQPRPKWSQEKATDGAEATAAAAIIQRVWRRKARRSVRPRCLWPSLSRLKEMYLDEVALAAGADEGEYYTDEMIVRREQLRSSHLVVEALRVAWERIAPIRGVMDFVKRVLCLSFTGCATDLGPQNKVLDSTDPFAKNKVIDAELLGCNR